MEDADPKLDFGGLNRRREQLLLQTKPQAEANVRMPTGASTDVSSSSFMARKPSTKTRTRAKADLEIKARSHGEMPVRANSSRKRADFGWLDERDDRREEKLRTFGKTSIDVPRPATFRNDSDEDVTTPVAVPSRYANAKTSSSAPLSASLPTGRSTNRRSHASDDPAAIADAQAAAWMRQELEKKRHEEASNPQARPSTAVRPPSRAASIKGSVKEYFIPGSRSRALSRAQSKESLRSVGTNDEQGLSRKVSNSGWRSWGIRRSTSRNNSRPGTSTGQAEEPQPRKSESNGLNLNRELPPLPSLDTWKDTWEEQDVPAALNVSSPKSPTAGTHIASLMRPQEQHQERSPSAQKQQRKSGSDAMAMQNGDAFPVRQSSRKQETKPIPPPIRIAPGSPGSPGNAEHIMTGWSSTSNLDHRLELSTGNHTRQRSGDSKSASNSNRSQDPSNFSHKMSLDSPARMTFANEPKTPGKEEQKSKLKKIFSGWMTKKDKKEDWMHKMEKEGVKEGVLVQESATASPVVRY
jgi:hypothetical protein